MTPSSRSTTPDDVELVIARLLLGGTIFGVALLAIGVLLMLVAGIDPLAVTFPAFDPGEVVADLFALRPEGFLWAGIVIVVATPIARIVGELVTFASRGDRLMALVSLAILGVVVLSVVVAQLVEG